jgi:hypothetical protein
MTVSSILNLLHELNKIILCQPLVSIILLYSTSVINSVINLHEFKIYARPCKTVFTVLQNRHQKAPHRLIKGITNYLVMISCFFDQLSSFDLYNPEHTMSQ